MNNRSEKSELDPNVSKENRKHLGHSNAFVDSHRARRIEKILAEVHSVKADAFLVFNHELSGQPGTKYLSGFSGTESVLLIAENGRFIFTDGRYFSQAKEGCPDFYLVPTGRSLFWEELEKICRKLDLKKIIFDSVRTNYGQVSRLKERMGNVSIIGVEKISFALIVASGQNGAKPHARATNKKVAKGELITFDFGCFYNGYASDITRTVALGNVSDKLAEIYETVKTAQELGCKAVKAGISGSEIDKICRDYISSKGYGEYFLHGTGHGAGMEVHELPYVSASNKEPLPENSVITVEPGIYIEGIGGVRIEDTVAVKKDGSINMSGGFSKELIVL